jgi:hypothetical protein
MLALARRHLEPGFGRGLVVRIDDARGESHRGREGAEQIVATAALAIAAHQAGDAELARQLSLGLASRAHVATELGGEPLFWLVAARAFGVFGGAERIAVSVEQGGEARVVELGSEAVVLPLELPRPGREARVRVVPEEPSGAVPLVTAVTRYVRPATELEAGPLRAALDGDPGFATERAAFVVTVSNAGETEVRSPIVLVGMPAGADLDRVGREAMQRSAGVVSVDEADRRGVIRVALAPLAAGARARMPLPIRWSAAGRRRGVILGAFPEDRPFELTVVPPGEVDAGFRPDEP